MSSCYPRFGHGIISNNGHFLSRFFQAKNHTDTKNNLPLSLMRHLSLSGPDRAGHRGHTVYPYLPHLLMVIVIIVIVSRFLHHCLRFVKQPISVCQLLTGILVFGFLPKPSETDPNLDGGMILNPPNRRAENVLGFIGTLLYIFIAGVKFDPALQLRLVTKKKTLIVGSFSLLIPLAAGFMVFGILKEQLKLLDEKQSRYITLALYVLSATFPVAVHEILEEFGLLNSELGRLALSSTMVQGLFGWPCVVAFTVVRQGQKHIRNGFFALLTFMVIVTFIVLVVYPYGQRIARTTPPSGRVSGVHITLITFLVILMGMLCDLSGTATFEDGAAIIGLALPEGPPLGTALLERVDLIGSELLLPIIFLEEGYYTDLMAAKKKLHASLLLGLLVIVMFIARIVANVAAALYCKMSLKDGLLLGFIMNFRGTAGMLFFMRLTNTRLMGRTTFTVLILASTITTAFCAPLVKIFYDPLVAKEQKLLRAVERVQYHAELNVMACFYDVKPVQALLEFLESLSCTLDTNNTACIYSLHLVEKKGRGAPSLICHRNEKGQISTIQMADVQNYFLNFEQAKRSAAINVIPFTSVASLDSMHRDICSLVLEKNIPLVIVPYPKKNTIADLEASTDTYTLVPLVLENARCSVGIMVYDGTTVIREDSYWQYHVCVLFWGGPDDRESIAIASRMARHSGVFLSVIRLLTSESTTVEKDVAANDNTQKVLDDKIINELEVANAGNNRVTVTNINVSNAHQLISVMKVIGDDKYNLLVVGRRQENLSVLGDGLAKWTESPELGVMGDMLSTDISGINVLIVQQHVVTLK